MKKAYPRDPNDPDDIGFLAEVAFPLLNRMSRRIDRESRNFSPVCRDTRYPAREEIAAYGVSGETTPTYVVIEGDEDDARTNITAYSEGHQAVLWETTLDAVVGELYPSVNELIAGTPNVPVEGQAIRVLPLETCLYLPTKDGYAIRIDYVTGQPK